MHKFLPQVSFFILVGLLTACANMPMQPTSPQVSLTEFKLVKLGLTEQNYRLRLNLKNPNPFPLPIQSLNYQLHINDKEFAHGTNTPSITIPASGEEFLDIDVISNLMRTIGQWGDLKSLLNQKFNYRLSGGVSMVGGMPEIPFEYEGNIPLSWKDSETGKKSD